MALSKAIETKFGISASYWRITYINSNFITGNTVAMLSGYANRDTRDGNVSRAIMDEIQIPLPSEMTRLDAYEYIKTLDEFIDADNI